MGHKLKRAFFQLQLDTWVGVSAKCVISTKPGSLESAGRNQETYKSPGEPKWAWVEVVL